MFRESASASARGSGFLLRSTDLHANTARLSKVYTSKKHYICWWELLSILPINSRRNLRVAANFSTTESKYIGLFPNAWISLTYRTYRGSVFLLINEKISDKLWESALADPFQFTIYSRQKPSLSRYGAREVHRIIKLCTFADLRRPINLTDLFRFTTHELLSLFHFLSYLSTEALPFLSWTSLNSIGSFSLCHSHL